MPPRPFILVAVSSLARCRSDAAYVPHALDLEDVLRGRTSARGTIGGAREAPGPTHARARVHQDETDLAAGGAASPYPDFIPGGLDACRWATHAKTVGEFLG